MGMYDEIKVTYPHNQLKKYKNIRFQTKDLECTMDLYSIDENGILFLGERAKRKLQKKDQLETFKQDIVSYRRLIKLRNNPFFTSFFKPKEVYYKTYIKSWKKQSYTGPLKFYTHLDINTKKLPKKYRWVEAECLFFKGKLKSIKVKDKLVEYENNN